MGKQAWGRFYLSVGIAVLEAMAMGKPVVATRTGGILEIVVENETGILVSPGRSDILVSGGHQAALGP